MQMQQEFVPSTTMLPDEDLYGNVQPPTTYGGMPMGRRYGAPPATRSPMTSPKGYEQPTRSWSASMARPVWVPPQAKLPPTADKDSPEPMKTGHKFNISEQNKQGVAVWDRKHRGVSRNVLGGFYTS